MKIALSKARIALAQAQSRLLQLERAGKLTRPYCTQLTHEAWCASQDVIRARARVLQEERR